MLMVIMFEVLMFIFENYMDSHVSLKTDNQTMVVELENVGFTRYEIDRALDWLEGLNRFQTAVESAPMFATHSLRHYVAEESEQLGVDGRGFLLYLEQLSILDPITREIVVDRVMALDSKEVDLGRIKWVVLMVLFSQPDKKSALSLLQDMILADAFDVLH
jgi:Smg protein